jgi:hypothetical protein
LLNNRIWASNNAPLWNSGTCGVTVCGGNLYGTSLNASMWA